MQQAGLVYELVEHNGRLAFNSGLPCSGTVIDATTVGEDVTAKFLLGERAGHHCDAPGTVATAVLRVRGGKIVVWNQLPTSESDHAA